MDNKCLPKLLSATFLLFLFLNSSETLLAEPLQENCFGNSTNIDVDGPEYRRCVVSNFRNTAQYELQNKNYRKWEFTQVSAAGAGDQEAANQLCQAWKEGKLPSSNQEETEPSIKKDASKADEMCERVTKLASKNPVKFELSNIQKIDSPSPSHQADRTFSENQVRDPVASNTALSNPLSCRGARNSVNAAAWDAYNQYIAGRITTRYLEPMNDAARSGDSWAIYMLGHKQFMNHIANPNDDITRSNSIEYLSKAADAGNCLAADDLIHLYTEGFNLNPKSLDQDKLVKGQSLETALHWANVKNSFTGRDNNLIQMIQNKINERQEYLVQTQAQQRAMADAIAQKKQKEDERNLEITKLAKLNKMKITSNAKLEKNNLQVKPGRNNALLQIWDWADQSEASRESLAKSPLGNFNNSIYQSFKGLGENIQKALNPNENSSLATDQLDQTDYYNPSINMSITDVKYLNGYKSGDQYIVEAKVTFNPNSTQVEKTINASFILTENGWMLHESKDFLDVAGLVPHVPSTYNTINSSESDSSNSDSNMNDDSDLEMLFYSEMLK